MTRIPVTVLTGFLGSGKTSLLNRILKDPLFIKTAVVINEYGDIDLDGVLVEHRTEQIIETTTGCLCCTLRGDIQETLLDLHSRRSSGSILPFERVIVETTGLADPDPVVYTVMGDIRLARAYELAGVITTVDAVNGTLTLRTHLECVQQAAVADRLVLTKSDLVKSVEENARTETLQGYLRELNPAAPILDVHAADFQLERLFDTSVHSTAGRGQNVLRWLNSEAYLAPKDQGLSHHVKSRGEDDPNAIEAYCIAFEKPVEFGAFSFSLQLLFGMKGPDLLRFKGIVNAEGHPERPVVIHAVQSVVDEPVILQGWPSQDRRTRLVLIGRGIPKASIQNLFRSFQSVPVRSNSTLVSA